MSLQFALVHATGWYKTFYSLLKYNYQHATYSPSTIIENQVKPSYQVSYQVSVNFAILQYGYNECS